ncbi:YcaO-like family protein [Streptosporangium sp. NPDC004379]|uniref:YcaO-like family protein n=1 Tax=Streptosporangium sp. NPDC004379 TaxID=3366189 RepID=UPI0036759B9E
MDQGDAAPRPIVRPLVGGILHVAWTADDAGVSGGACDADPGRAARRAAGEYAQHVSHLSASGALPVLAGPGDRPVIAPAAHAAAGSPPTSWVAGHGMRDGTEVAVPAQAVFLGWDPPPPETRWCVQTSAGTAAGPDRERARTAALLEVIERHVLERGWRTGDILFEELDHLHDAVLPPGLTGALRAGGVVLRTFRVAGLSPDVVTAFLHRSDGTALTCGAAARGDTADAVRHAVYEAVGNRLALSAPRRPARPGTRDRGEVPAQPGTRDGSSARPGGRDGSPTRPGDRDRERGLAAAAAGPRHLDFVRRRTSGAGEPRTVPVTTARLLETAEALFGHQPAEVRLPSVGPYAVHRVVCHGSEVLQPLTPPAGLACPIA